MLVLDPKVQVAKWRELNRWIETAFAKERIPDQAFAEIEASVAGSPAGTCVFYGFGDNGEGFADPFLTGHIFVAYLVQKYPHERSRFVDFYPTPPDPARFDFYRPKMKMREGAASRPKGFYTQALLPEDAKSGIGTTHRALSPADVRKKSPWGFGPEGFQFLALHDDYVKQMLDGKLPTFVLGDYAIAPYGGNEFYSAPLLGHLRGRLEIGATNVRDNIPRYAPAHFA